MVIDINNAPLMELDKPFWKKFLIGFVLCIAVLAVATSLLTDIELIRTFCLWAAVFSSFLIFPVLNLLPELPEAE